MSKPANRGSTSTQRQFYTGFTGYFKRGAPRGFGTCLLPICFVSANVSIIAQIGQLANEAIDSLSGACGYPQAATSAYFGPYDARWRIRRTTIK